MIAETFDFSSGAGGAGIIFRSTEKMLQKKGLALMRRNKLFSKYSCLTELETRFLARLKGEVFLLEDNRDFIKQNLKNVVLTQSFVPDKVKKETKEWFNIMSVRNQKLLKRFPDYIDGKQKTSELVKSPQIVRTNVAPMILPVKIFSGKRKFFNKSNGLLVKDYLYLVNKDDSTISIVAKDLKMGFIQKIVSANQGQLHPLEFYTPEKGFKVIYFNQKDNSFWLSNRDNSEEESKNGNREIKKTKDQQRLTRLNFLETPRARDIPLPDLSKEPFNRNNIMVEENWFGYSEFLSKYFMISDSSLIIFEDEADFTKFHQPAEFSKEGSFESCKFSFFSSKSESDFGTQLAIVQYNILKNWRFILFDFKKMKVVLDLSFQSNLLSNFDFELFQFKEVEIKKNGSVDHEGGDEDPQKRSYGLICLVDSFFNRVVIGSLQTNLEEQQIKIGDELAGNSYFVVANLVNTKGELVSTEIAKSKLKNLSFLNFN